MKKILLIFVAIGLLSVSMFAAPGTLNLLFANEQIVEDSVGAYFEFDVQGYLTEGNDSEVLRCGMIYVEYPTNVFGDLAITNDIVTYTKTGILGIIMPEFQVDIYDIFENDTYADVYALTFDAQLGTDSSFVGYFEAISSDPLAPSDMLHIRMAMSDYGTGNVLYPSYIPGLDNVYYNFDNETFSGGLDVTQAMVELVYEDTTVTDTTNNDTTIVDPPVVDPVGSLVYKSLDVTWKKDYVEVKWLTSNEVNIEGYVVKRYEDGSEPVEVASYLTDPALIAVGGVNTVKYLYQDYNVLPGVDYAYLIEAIDTVGCAFPCGPEGTSDAIVAAYPNPFNPSFVVPFELSAVKEVNIKLYDMTGRVVKDIASGKHTAGRYEYNVNCENLSSGVYLLRTIIDNNPTTQKMLLIK